MRFSDGSGVRRSASAALINTGIGGIGIQTSHTLHVHSVVEVAGKQDGFEICQQAVVQWRRPVSSGGYRTGLKLLGEAVIKPAGRPYSTR